MKLLIIMLMVLLPLAAIAQHHERAFKRIDTHARNAPFFSNPEKLVEYLIEPCKNDWQKTRAIFIWMTNNIAYDTYSYRSGTITHEKCKAMNVFNARKGVCSGYANLFEFLCGFAEINCLSISGYAKGAGHYTGQVFSETNHAWNICEFDGQFHLFDVTWAAGHYSYGSFIKAYKDFWWDTPPNLFITTHYAIPPDFNNLSNFVSKSEFEHMSPVRQYTNLQKTALAQKPVQLSISAGVAGVFKSVDNLAEGDGFYQAALYFGWLKVQKGYGQNFYGLFTTLDFDQNNAFTIEAGSIVRRFWRISAGARCEPSLSKPWAEQQWMPSLTTGVRINIASLFFDMNLNVFQNSHKQPDGRLIAAVGICF